MYKKCPARGTWATRKNFTNKNNLNNVVKKCPAAGHFGAEKKHEK